MIYPSCMVFKQARHLHLGKLQVRGNTHDGDILSRVVIFSFPAFMSVRNRVVGWGKRVLASVCIALQRLSILRLLMCLFVQHESRLRHVSFVLTSIGCIVVSCLLLEHVFEPHYKHASSLAFFCKML